MVALLLLAPLQTCALTPTTRIDDYALSSWGREEGLPQKFVRSLARTADGYLWVGTQQGLARFDGVRFVVFDVGNTPALLNNEILTLTPDPSGGLWVGTRGGLTRAISAGSSAEWSIEPAAGVASMSQLVIDSGGAVVLAGGRRGLQRLRPHADADTRLVSLIAPVSSGYPGVVAHRAPDGAIWVYTESAGIQQLTATGLETVIAPALLQGQKVLALMVQRDGSIWAGTGRGVLRWRSGALTDYRQAQGLTDQAVLSLLEDMAGNIWVGSEFDGLFRFDADAEKAGRAVRFARPSAHHPIRQMRINALLEDVELNLWLGTADGLHRLRDAPVASLSGFDAFSNDEVWSVLEGAAGTAWAGTAGRGVVRVLNGQATRFEHAANGSVATVYGLAVDPMSGRLWVATGGSGVFELRGDTFERIPSLAVLDQSDAFAIFRDSNRRLWIASAPLPVVHYLEDGVLRTLGQPEYLGGPAWVYAEGADRSIWWGTRGNGVFRRDAGGTLSQWNHANGLSNDVVIALHVDQEGAIWVVTTAPGLNRIKADQLAVLTVREGMPTSSIRSMVADDRGLFWLCTGSGLYFAPMTEFIETADGRRRRVSLEHYGKDDGLRASDCSAGGQPAAWKSLDGSLLFATESGVARVRSGPLVKNPLAPPVAIESVRVDAAAVPFDPVPAISAGNHRVGFRFTALSLQAPSRVRFRHQLEGFDADWIEGSARTVSYTNLSPGHYRFRVIGSNNDGVWNTEGASVAFRVNAPFYQTGWFYALIAALISSFVWLAWRVRTGRLRAHNAVLSERNRIARELHDTMAQGLVGIKVQIQVLRRLVGRVPETLPQFMEHLDHAEEIADDSIAEARQSVAMLRGGAVVEADPPGTIAAMIDALILDSGIDLDLHIEGEPRSLDSARCLDLLRLVREAVANVVRHAGASALRVVIHTDDVGLRITIADDGIGFDPQAGDPQSHGLLGMRERAERIGATFVLNSEPGRGTLVDVTLPVAARRR